MTNPHLFFQYCPKFVIFNHDFSQILLCRRTGEADFDRIYSFAGGKVETTDKDVRQGMIREKQEELGVECSIRLLSDISIVEQYTKKDGSSMILPHYIALYEGGEITLSEEYDDYQRVDRASLDHIDLPIIPSIPRVIAKLSAYIDADILQTSHSFYL